MLAEWNKKTKTKTKMRTYLIHIVLVVRCAIEFALRSGVPVKKGKKSRRKTNFHSLVACEIGLEPRTLCEYIGFCVSTLSPRQLNSNAFM